MTTVKRIRLCYFSALLSACVNVSPNPITITRSSLSFLLFFQVQNYFQRTRPRLLSVFTNEGNSVGSLHRWANELLLTADSPIDELRVLPGHRAQQDDILVGLSTRGLLTEARRALEQSGVDLTMAVDNTYCLTRHGYVCQVYGLILPNGHFHQLALIVSMNETQSTQEDGIKSLCDGYGLVNGVDFEPMHAMADSALSIKKALKAIFPNIKVGVCFFHMKKGLTANKAKFTNDDNYIAFCADVDLVHSVTDIATFEVALTLLLKQWNNSETEAVSWFSQFWGKEGNREWGAGHTPWGFPAVNNHVESKNNQMKTYTTKRMRCNLGVLLRMMQRELKFTSNQAHAVATSTRSPGKKEFGVAQLWLKKYGGMVIREAGGTFLVPSAHAHAACTGSHATPASRADLAKFWRRRTVRPTRNSTVRSYVKKHLQFYELTPMSSEESKPFGPLAFFRCSCVFAFKNGFCKHALALSIKENKVQVPLEWIINSLPDLKKRGRPRKAPLQQQPQPKRTRRAARR